MQAHKLPAVMQVRIPEGDRRKLSNPRGSSSSAPMWRQKIDIAERHEALFPGVFKLFRGNRQEGGFQGHNGPTSGMLYRGQRADFLAELDKGLARPNDAIKRHSQAADVALQMARWEQRPRTNIHDGDYGMFAAQNPRVRYGNTANIGSSSPNFVGAGTPFGGGPNLFNRPPVPGAPRDGSTGLWHSTPWLTYGMPRPNVPQVVRDDMARARGRVRNEYNLPIAEIPITTAENPRQTGDFRNIALLGAVLAVLYLMRGRLG